MEAKSHPRERMNSRERKKDESQVPACVSGWVAVPFGRVGAGKGGQEQRC